MPALWPDAYVILGVSMTKREDRMGKAGQNIAASVLSGMGIEMVEKIGTPVRLVPVNPRQNIFKVFWEEAVSGDHRGILPGGISVLAETKTILDRNLRYSDLRHHQPERLQEHSQHGGISLLIWVNGSYRENVFVMLFPIIGFEPGKSIKVEEARYEDQVARRFIYQKIEENR